MDAAHCQLFSALPSELWRERFSGYLSQDGCTILDESRAVLSLLCWWYSKCICLSRIAQSKTVRPLMLGSEGPVRAALCAVSFAPAVCVPAV